MASAGGIKAGKAFVEIEALDKTAAVLKTVHRRMQSFASGMSNLGRGMLQKGLAALMPAGLSLKVFANFDDALRKVEARSSGTAGEMKALRDQAKELGRTTSFTAAQIGELQAKLAQKGFSRAQLFQMTPAVQDLARGAGEGNEEDATLAADLVSGTLRAFQLDADQSGRVADVMTAAVNNSNFTLQTLIDSMKYASPVAKQFGLSLEETVATVAQMTNVNLDASTAGTSFRNMLLKLSDAGNRTKFLERLRKETGQTVEMLDSAGNLKKLPEILFAVGEATKGISNAKRADLFNQLFGMRVITGAMVLGEGENPFGDLLQTLEQSQGTARKTAKEMDAGLGGSFRILWSAVEGVAISLGEALAPEVSRMAQLVSDFLPNVAQWIDDHRNLIVTITTGIAAFVGAGAALFGLGLAVKALAIGIGGLQVVTSVLHVVFAALLSPVGLVAAAIVGLGALLYQFSGSFRSIVNGIAGFAAERFQAIAGTIGGTFKGVMDAISTGDFEEAFGILVEGLEVAWDQFVDALYDAWDSFCGFFLEAWVGAIVTIREALLNLQKTISTGILDLAGQTGTLGAMFSWVLGVDMAETNKQMEELNKKLKASGAKIGITDGNPEAGSSPESIRRDMRAQYDKQIATVREDAGRRLSDRDQAIRDRNTKRDESLANRRAALAKRIEQAELDAWAAKRHAASEAVLGIEQTAQAKRTEAETAASGIASAAASPVIPRLSEGLERGTKEAYQTFQENRFNNSEFAKQLAELAKQSGLLETIADNTAGDGEEGV